MKIKCDWCGSYMEDTQEKCENCGAVNEHMPRGAASVPKTIEELKAFCEARKLPLQEMRFFLGVDYKEPKAFGIYQDNNGDFVVYKNKADGTRAVRYRGRDQAYAVNELYQKMKAEVMNQKAHAMNKQQRARKKESNAKSIVIIALVVILVIMFVVKFMPDKGYYEYEGSYYYYDSDDWYWYNTAAEAWYPTQVDSELSGHYSDYHLSDFDYEDYGVSDFTQSEYYSDSDWDSDDDWDFGGSWDSDFSDWDSDW